MTADPVRPGEEWGRPAAPDEVASVLPAAGDDAAVAEAAATHPGAVQRMPASGDLARALGGRGPGGRVVDCDTFTVDGLTGVNAAVLGIAPRALRPWHRRRRVTVTVDGRALTGSGGEPLRATTVVVASGQFLDGDDLVPRGHPGDGRLEVLVLGLAPRARRAFRRRLPRGDHLPHPGIAAAGGREVRVDWSGAARPCVVDGRRREPRTRAEVRVEPGGLSLLV